MKLSKQTVAQLKTVLDEIVVGCYDETGHCIYCEAGASNKHRQITGFDHNLGATITSDCPILVAQDLIERGVLND